jgi:hypothetical protein
MTSDEIIQALLTDDHVFLHYTSEAGASQIKSTGVIRPNDKMVVYLTQEPMSADAAHTSLFIGATTHVGRGTHVIVLRLDSGLSVRRTGPLEFAADQIIRLDQHRVLYIGPNPS